MWEILQDYFILVEGLTPALNLKKNAYQDLGLRDGMCGGRGLADAAVTIS